MESSKVESPVDKVSDSVSSGDVEIVVKKGDSDKSSVIGMKESEMNEEKKREETKHKPET